MPGVLNANAGNDNNAQLKCISHMHDIEIWMPIWIVNRSGGVNRMELNETNGSENQHANDDLNGNANFN